MLLRCLPSSFLPALRLTTSSIAQLQTSYSNRAETLQQASREGNPGRGDSLLGSLPVLLGPSIPGGKVGGAIICSARKALEEI
ncbi:hypothetical protein QYF36_008644 [Acer negundo]|nr:hypothetical protein QYF36_008644 [Acer negundo]